MSKKDYIKIAAVLFQHHVELPLIETMATMLKEDNPNFDRMRFLAAALRGV